MPSKRKHARKTGLPPGSLIYVGDKQGDEAVLVEESLYDKKSFATRHVDLSANDLKEADGGIVQWLRVCGIHNVGTIEKIGETFDLHPVILEDILNSHSGTQLLEVDECLLLQIALPIKRSSAETRLLTIVHFADVVLTFEEESQSQLDLLFNRLEKAKGHIRDRGADYLFYALLDLAVDFVMERVEYLRSEADELESDIMQQQDHDSYQRLFNFKKDIIDLKRRLRRLAEMLTRLIKTAPDFARKENRVYVQDVEGHLLLTVSKLDQLSEVANSMMQFHAMLASSRLNQTMKTLTIIGTIFLPLTFLAGVYGMNFENIPELKWNWAYPLFWGFVLTIAGGLALFFKRKKWL